MRQAVVSIKTPRDPPSTPSRSQRLPILCPPSASKPIPSFPQSSDPTVGAHQPCSQPSATRSTSACVPLLIPNQTSHLQSHTPLRLTAIRRGYLDVEDAVDADQPGPDLVFIGSDRGGAEALSSVWQAPHSQECLDEGAESSSLHIHCGFWCTLTSRDM